MSRLRRSCHLSILDLDVLAMPNAFENLTRFFAAANAYQVAWRVWEHFDERSEKKGRKALESEEKTPPYSGISLEAIVAFHESQTERKPISDRDAEVIGLLTRNL